MAELDPEKLNTENKEVENKEETTAEESKESQPVEAKVEETKKDENGVETLETDEGVPEFPSVPKQPAVEEVGMGFPDLPPWMRHSSK